MSKSTTAKRIRKEVRKNVAKKLGDGMEALNQIVRPRPRFIPKWVWIFVYMPLFKKQYLGLVYKYMK